MVDFAKFAADPDRADQMRWNVRPLVTDERPEAYPVHTLPPIVRDAVVEVGEWTQAPAALIAGSALSAVSASVQTRFSVRRAYPLEGPATLFLLTVAESGERKSTVDGLFTAPIRAWQEHQRQEHKRRVAEYNLDLADWANANPDGGDRDACIEHEMLKPTEPKERRVLRGDDTSEALVTALQDYPVAAIISAEAGVIFGSHSMKSDNVTANLALVNQLWSGETIDQGRIKRGVVHITRPRVTMGLQVQPAVLSGFMQASGGLAKGIGYFARFLFAHPESTIGGRFFKEAPATQPALTLFQTRMTQLLDLEPAFDAFGQLEPTYIEMDDDALDTWVKFNDETEELMGGDEDYCSIRGEASKAAENAARLACCFHVFAGEASAKIGRMTMTDACRLMRWYLAEAMRFARTRDATPEVHHAQVLEDWLVSEVKRRARAKEDVLVAVNEVRQRGPNALRGGGKIDAAVELLCDLGRVRLFKRIGRKGHDIVLAPTVFQEYC